MNKEQFDQETKELNVLQEEFIKLQEKYDNLQNEYTQLQNEYTENIIIQSMNEMKVRYETMLKTTVPSYKYKFLQEKHDKMVKNYAGCSILIDHVIKLLRKLEHDIHSVILKADNKNVLLKAELELVTIKEILEDNV